MCWSRCCSVQGQGMSKSKSTAKRQAAAILANPGAFRELSAGPAGGMSAEELAAANQAWARRQARIPATFGTYERYLEAVAAGLLERAPCGTYKQLSERELIQQIEAAKTEPMPPWRPRPEGPSKLCLLALASFYDRDTDDDD